MCLLDALSGGNAAVAVLATTSRIGALDPALRRPGRLDVEVGEDEIPTLTCRQS